jgi:hypothetical protein
MLWREGQGGRSVQNGGPGALGDGKTSIRGRGLRKLRPNHECKLSRRTGREDLAGGRARQSLGGELKEA